MEKYEVINNENLSCGVVLKEVGVNGNICGEFVEFSILQIYENKSEQNIEAVYTFPIEDTAILTGFEANLGGRTLKAIVENKEEAKNLLKRDIEAGINTLSLEEDDNIYKITIGNILPGESVKITLSYMDQLVFEDNKYKLTIPFVEAPKLMSYDSINEESECNNYDMYLNLLVESFNKLKITSPSHGINVDYETPTLCKITLKEGERLNDDFELVLKEEKGEDYSGMTYSFPKHEKDESIVYLRLNPKLNVKNEMIPEEYIFLLDISKSMKGEKLEQAKDAIELCVRNLEEGDKFNIVAFHRDLKIFSKDGLIDFNEENVNNAAKWLRGITFGRSANVYDALKWTLDNNKDATIILFTDDMVENAEEVLSYVKENIGENRIYPIGVDSSVNSYFINTLANIGYGRPEFINVGERIEDMILRQFNRIVNPQVDVRSITWGENIEVLRTYPRTIEYLYDREPFSVFAKVKGEAKGAVTIKGFVNNEEFEEKINLDSFELRENAYLVEKVWARKRIESIEERMRSEVGETRNEMRIKAEELSKEYNIVSEETAFVMLEQIEEPVMGIVMNKIMPIDISEETLYNLSYAYFLENPAFMYKAEEKKHKKKESQKFIRENLLRVIAKNQRADGSFYNEQMEDGMTIIDTTLEAMLAFTIGNDDIAIYNNGINKALRYVIEHLRTHREEIDERLSLLYLLTFQLLELKDIVKKSNRDIFYLAYEEVRSFVGDNEYISISYLEEDQDFRDLKKSVQFMLGLDSEVRLTAEEIEKLDDEDNISKIIDYAIWKAL